MSGIKKAPQPEMVARIVRWAIMLFFAYAILSGGFHLLPEPPTPKRTGVINTAPAQKECGPKPIEQFSSIAAAVLPTFVPIIHTQDIKPGSGALAACGQLATLHYQYAAPDGSVIFSNLSSNEPTHAIIGAGHLLHGLELGMIGMKPGGERQIAFPSALGLDRVHTLSSLYDSAAFAQKIPSLKKAILTGTVVLDSVSPELPVSEQPLRIIDQMTSTGAHVQCGDTVQVEMSVWKLDGTKLFSTGEGKPVIFTIGTSQVPYGIEEGVVGMVKTGIRTIILPAAFTQPLQSDVQSVLGNITLPAETVLVEVHLMHIGSDSSAALPVKKPATVKPTPADKETDSYDTDTPAASHQPQ